MGLALFSFWHLLGKPSLDVGYIPCWDGGVLLLGRDGNLFWKAGPLCIFWTVWKARNGVVFRDEILSIQKLKFSFVNLLWLETDLFIEDDPTSLCQFIHWVGVK